MRYFLTRGKKLLFLILNLGLNLSDPFIPCSLFRMQQPGFWQELQKVPNNSHFCSDTLASSLFLLITFKTFSLASFYQGFFCVSVWPQISRQTPSLSSKVKSKGGWALPVWSLNHQTTWAAMWMSRSIFLKMRTKKKHRKKVLKMCRTGGDKSRSALNQQNIYFGSAKSLGIMLGQI